MLFKRLLSFFCFILFFAVSMNAQQIGGANTASEVCFSCHKDQAADWKTTWHSRSHIDTNPLYEAVVNYMSRAMYQPNENILIECAQCHNPKMTIKEITNKNSFTIAKALHIETNQTKTIDASVDDQAIKDGISCSVCHSVEKINESSDLDLRGFRAVEWGPSDTIFGPFEHDGRTTLHKAIQKEHFTDPNKLCMVCHFGGERNNIEVYATGVEYAQAQNQTKCAECHMSTKREGVIAPEIKKTGITPQIRNIRSHLFEGARNGDILATTVDLRAINSGQNLIVELQNLTPHKAPTGFGGRSMNVKVEFKNGSSLIDAKVYTLEVIYLDRRGRETIPYLASSVKSDTRLEAEELRRLNIVKPAGATSATVSVTYRLASERVLKIINFSDPVFNKEYSVESVSIDL